MQVDIPFSAGVPTGYVRSRFFVKLNGDQAETLRRVQDEMTTGEVALSSGRIVRDGGDAILGVLEAIAAAEPE